MSLYRREDDMKDFGFEQTSMAQWYSLLQDAENTVGAHLNEDIEHYLALTLDGFTTDITSLSGVVAIDYLESIELKTQNDINQLRNVGDCCLVLSGLFPERALKRRTTLDYFVAIGRQAYYSISYVKSHAANDPELFQSLCHQFVEIKDILGAMRNIKRQLQ